MGYYKTCLRCGANLDPGEVCDCGAVRDNNAFDADTRQRISDMLCKITDEKLLDRIYRFTKYIYLHREGAQA